MSSWYSKGLRFSCTGCGDCCRTHGEYRWVFVDASEIDRLAAALRVSRAAFVRDFTEEGPDGARVLRWPDGHCVLLGEQGCTGYAARPGQCRTWPFWPENLERKAWKTEVAPFCPGVGEGRLYRIGEVRRIARGDGETGS